MPEEVWTIEALHASVQVQLAAMQEMIDRRVNHLVIRLDERHVSQTRIMDNRIDALALRLDERHAIQTRAIERTFEDAEKNVKIAMAASDKATAKAEIATQHRFEAVNEFRQTLSDQVATFVPRAEADEVHSRISERMEDMKGRLDLIEGAKRGSTGAVAVMFATATIVISIVVLLANLLSK